MLKIVLNVSLIVTVFCSSVFAWGGNWIPTNIFVPSIPSSPPAGNNVACSKLADAITGATASNDKIYITGTVYMSGATLNPIRFPDNYYRDGVFMSGYPEGTKRYVYITSTSFTVNVPETDRITFRDLRFYGPTNGTAVKINPSVCWAQFVNCDFYFSSTTGGQYGCRDYGSQSVYFDHCTFKYSKVGYYVTQGQQTEFNNNCTFQNSQKNIYNIFSNLTVFFSQFTMAGSSSNAANVYIVNWESEDYPRQIWINGSDLGHTSGSPSYPIYCVGDPVSVYMTGNKFEACQSNGPAWNQDVIPGGFANSFIGCTNPAP